MEIGKSVVIFPILSKPELSGKTGTIAAIYGSVPPFHYLVKVSEIEDWLVRGDEIKEY